MRLTRGSRDLLCICSHKYISDYILIRRSVRNVLYSKVSLMPSSDIDVNTTYYCPTYAAQDDPRQERPSHRRKHSINGRFMAQAVRRKGHSKHLLEEKLDDSLRLHACIRHCVVHIKTYSLLACLPVCFKYSFVLRWTPSEPKFRATIASLSACPWRSVTAVSATV